LAQLILSDSSLAAQLRPRFIPAGEWVAGTRYYANNLVTVNGSSYYLVANSSLGQPPASNPTVWQLIAQRGEAGTGVTGYSQVYGPAWDGSTAPPTQNDLFDIIETKYDKASAQLLAPKADPTFTGTVTTPTPASNVSYGDTPATTKWFWDILEGASLLSKAAPTTPGAPTASLADISGKLANTSWVKEYVKLSQVNSWYCLDVYNGSTYNRYATVTVSQNQQWAASTSYNFNAPSMSGSWSYVSSILKTFTGNTNAHEYDAWAFSQSSTPFTYTVRRLPNTTLTSWVYIGIFLVLVGTP